VTPTQLKLVRYLSEDGHPQRHEMLGDIRISAILAPDSSEDYVREEVERYLRQNPRGFCAEVIERLKKYMGWQEPGSSSWSAR
jgi:hypothetical protein